MERQVFLALSAVLAATLAGAVSGPLTPIPAAAARSPATVMVAQAASPSAAIAVEDDPYKPAIFYHGAWTVLATPSESIRWKLVGRKLRRYGVRTYYLEVLTEYRAANWLFYERALADSGEILGFVPKGRQFSNCASGRRGCDFSESFDVTLKEALLRRAATAGLEIRLLALTGHAVAIAIPPSLAAALLAEME